MNCTCTFYYPLTLVNDRLHIYRDKPAISDLVKIYKQICLIVLIFLTIWWLATIIIGVCDYKKHTKTGVAITPNMGSKVIINVDSYKIKTKQSDKEMRRVSEQKKKIMKNKPR